jgi:Reverse transcriptase (RNA-dependent DNA polymerase).
MDSEKSYQLIMLHISLQILLLKHGTRKCTFLVFFCDLAKEFDCVNHELLVSKLNYYGIKGEILDWFKSLENTEFSLYLYKKQNICSSWDLNMGFQRAQS